MIDWHRVDADLPKDGEECLLYSEEAGHVIGPLTWKKTGQTGMWVDLFGPYASKEAGVCFTPGSDGGPTHWAIWTGPPAALMRCKTVSVAPDAV